MVSKANSPPLLQAPQADAVANALALLFKLVAHFLTLCRKQGLPVYLPPSVLAAGLHPSAASNIKEMLQLRNLVSDPLPPPRRHKHIGDEVPQSMPPSLGLSLQDNLSSVQFAPSNPSPKAAQG